MRVARTLCFCNFCSIDLFRYFDISYERDIDFRSRILLNIISTNKESLDDGVYLKIGS